MQSVPLGHRVTSRLGFGGSLLGSIPRRAAIRLLHAAYDLGIRHYDVAPLYGFGEAEKLVRDAFRGRAHTLTLTTKYGIDPVPHGAVKGKLHRLLRTVAAPLIKSRKPHPPSPHQLLAEQGPAPPITGEGARRSFTQSMRNLQVECIDVFLLHEATPQRVRDESLLGVLQDLQSKGSLTLFGVGSEPHFVKQCLRERPELCQIVQFQSSALLPPAPTLEGSPHIVHGSLGGSRLHFLEWLHSDAQKCRRWSDAMGRDLSRTQIVNRLLMRISLLRNPGCILLFSTKELSRIQDNVDTESDTSMDQAALVFYELIQKEYVSCFFPDGPVL